VGDEMGDGPRGPERGEYRQMSTDEEGVKGREPHRTARGRAGGSEHDMVGKGGPRWLRTEQLRKMGSSEHR
jgi:hypothetical protein